MKEKLKVDIKKPHDVTVLFVVIEHKAGTYLARLDYNIHDRSKQQINPDGINMFEVGFESIEEYLKEGTYEKHLL